MLAAIVLNPNLKPESWSKRRDVHIPRVIYDASSTAVLTTEFCPDLIRVSDFDGLR